MLKRLKLLLWLLINMWHIISKAVLNQNITVSWYVQVGCYCKAVAFLSMQITLGQNQITNTFNFCWAIHMTTTVKNFKKQIDNSCIL